jgi:CHAT domain-containing protein/tetratricopeptide (TPR) repeat protein
LRRRRRPRGSAIGLVLVSLAAATLTGCHSAAAPDPAAIFENIRNDFLHGNLDIAQQKAEKARQDFSASGADWAMRFRVLEAEILTYQGRRPDVLALLNDPHVSYPSMGDLAIKRYSLCAMAHARLGQGQQADSELQEAQRLSDASHSALNGEVLRTEATVQNYRGHLTEAADLFRKSLKVAREERDDAFLEASDLLNLGMVAFEMERYDEALASLNEAANLARPIQARLVLEAAAGNSGSAYFQLGDFQKALSSYQQAEKEAKEIGTTSAQVDWLGNEGSAYYRLGDLQQAKTCYEQALKAALAIDNREEIVIFESELADLLFHEGQFDSAKTHSDNAIRIARISGDQAGELEPLVLQALLAAKQENGQDAERMLMQVYGKSAEHPSLRVQIENALATFYAGKKQTRRAELWYRKSILTFEDQRAAIKDEELRLPFFANGDAFYRDYADFLISYRKQEEALQLLDIGRARTLAEGLGLAKEKPMTRSEPTGDAQAAASRLNSTILFYSLGPKKSWLWTITPHHTHLLSLPAQSAIETQVHSYQNAILKSTDPLREQNQAAKTLYETLVAPASEMIPKGSKVLIIPDGVLNGLNFETLLAPGSDRSHYWIEDVTIRNANSIRMLSGVNPDASHDNAKKLLLIGNPIITGTGYDNLVNAFAEIRDIEKHFPPDSRTVVTQSEAVPASYLESKPEEFSYIHFVAHGTASRLDPLDSAVVLSPPPDNPDNFKLYARDIMRDPLHARLVTISSCYGSGSRAYAGEGLVGLSWAFLRAGAHNVIGALWEVNDASTPLLMDRLYAGLEAGSTPDDALRAAKLSLIHSPAVYRKPLYWAAFQLYTGS